MGSWRLQNIQAQIDASEATGASIPSDVAFIYDYLRRHAVGHAVPRCYDAKDTHHAQSGRIERLRPAAHLHSWPVCPTARQAQRVR